MNLIVELKSSDRLRKGLEDQVTEQILIWVQGPPIDVGDVWLTSIYMQSVPNNIFVSLISVHGNIKIRLMNEMTRGKSKLVDKLTSHIQKIENTLFSIFGPLN